MRRDFTNIVLASINVVVRRLCKKEIKAQRGRYLLFCSIIF